MQERCGKVAFDKDKYDREYHKANYHFIRVVIPKESLQDVKDVAERKGKSISSLFVEAFEKVYGVYFPRKD